MMRCSILAVAALLTICVVVSPASGGLLQSGNLVYKGAFRIPTTGNWAYGSTALTYYAAGDSGNADGGYGGSLFASGNAFKVAELSIPTPVITKVVADLPRAGLLQALTDVGHSMYAYSYHAGDDKIVGGGGSGVVDSGYIDRTLATPNVQGPWKIKAGQDYRYSGDYQTAIPAAFVAAHPNIAGMDMAQGGCWESYGEGPALWAYEYDNPTGDPLELTGVKLLHFDNHQMQYQDQVFDTNNDRWYGAEWIKTAGGIEAVVIAGKHDIDGAGTMRATLLFFDPEDLGDVADGTIDPWDPQPYDVVYVEDDLITTTRHYYNSLAYGYDAVTGKDLLIAVEYGGGGTEGRCAWHVYEIPEPATMGLLSLGFFGLAALRRRRRA